MHLSVDASLLAVSETTMIAALSLEAIFARSVFRSMAEDKVVVMMSSDVRRRKRGRVSEWRQECTQISTETAIQQHHTATSTTAAQGHNAQWRRSAGGRASGLCCLRRMHVTRIR